jgi:hypothetical protein
MGEQFVMSWTLDKTAGAIEHAWTPFDQRQPLDAPTSFDFGYVSNFTARPDRPKMYFSSERTIIGAIYNRLGVDVAAMEFRHVRTDGNDRYKETIKSGLNDCLTTEANIDQEARAFVLDYAMTLFDVGVLAIVPVETTLNPTETGGWDVKNMRIGEITSWHPRHVRVKVYNEKNGKREEITLPKSMVAIIENPFYNVMNEPNSTLQRLLRTLSLIDSVDQQNGSGKLDLIIQLPYVIKSEARRQAAEQRRKDIEFQLQGSKYGIAYTDGTEKVVQLNRAADNTLMSRVEYLVNMLYSQLGLTPEIMNGTADETAMLNYYNRTIEPIVAAFVNEIRRKFLSKTARTQGQTVMAFRDPFKLVPMEKIADIADKFTRNEILSSNDVRTAIGYLPSSDPKADELRNSNMPAPSESGTPVPDPTS